MHPKLVNAFRGVQRYGKTAVAAALLVVAAGAWTDLSAQTSQQKRAAIRANSPFNLKANATHTLSANLVRCGLDNNGNVCTDVFNSPTGGGGFWPSTTVNQYIFNSGLQIAGIYGAGAPTSGVFTIGDTVGAYFFDARGTQPHGSPLTQIYSSLNPDDLANWPEEALISDTSLFSPQLIGRKSVSDEDTWVKYWDGDPNRLGGGREHPMGIQVTQRSMAFNAPRGAENSLFFIYEFKNITNTPEFQLPNEQRFNQNLPDAGWTIDSIYAAFGMDPDVTANGAGSNFSTAILPFNMAVAYKDDFTAPEFDFSARADLYAPPFFVGPGFVGVKYLRSPIDPNTGREVGLTFFTNNTNGGAFPDPQGVTQLWRYISNNVTSAKGDPVCNIPNPKEARLCYLAQDPADTRFIMSSGPFSLKAGESATIVVAYSHGAPVAIPGYTPGDVVRPGIPTVTPGVNGQPLRDIERIAGLINIPGDAIDPVTGNVIQSRVNVVRNSVIFNANIGQTIFGLKFLLPSPPEPPQFVLVPGDNRVTIVWQPSVTETQGDPYFSIASDPNSPLFDPNFRRFDVEGYRIYRATGLSGAFEPIAGFNKEGTCIEDFTGQFDPRFVPELGQSYEAFLTDLGEHYPACVPLTGAVVQFPAGGRVQDVATGSVIVVRADTVDLRSEIEQGGVPFAFVDENVRNGITYRYAVTAYDINSLQSGVGSLESARQAKAIVPRAQPANQVLASFSSSLQGDNGNSLNPNADLPTIDPNAGTFSGPMPPTNTIDATFAPLVPQLLPAFKLTATIDSVIPMNAADFPEFDCPNGSSIQGTCWRAYLTYDLSGQKTPAVADGYTPALGSDVVSGGEPAPTEFPLGSAIVPPDAGLAEQFDLPTGFQGFAANVVGTFPDFLWYSSAEGQLNRRSGGCNVGAPPFPTNCLQRMHGGSRWFSGANETVADPTTFIRVGHLAGIDSIWAPINHTPRNPTTGQYAGSTCMQSLAYAVGFLSRAADIRFTWGGAGFSAVRDIVHNVNLRFSPIPQAGTWGFLTDANGNGVLDYQDAFYIDRVNQLQQQVLGFCSIDADHIVPLTNTPTVMPISLSGTDPVAATPEGNGFMLYVDGEFYIFKTDAAPAANTVWTLRKYSGQVRVTPTDNFDASGYTFISRDRPPLIPGLKIVFESAAPTQLVGDIDLSKVHTTPDPYYIRSEYELGPNNKRLLFQNLPPQAIVRIFSVNGTLVRVLEHNDALGGGQLEWDLRNRNNQFVATGVYFYVVEASDGQKKVGKFTVLQFTR